MLRNRIIFSLVVLGVAAALTSAALSARPHRPVPPLFTPPSNPYASGIYASGIIESFQSNGQNINIYPEVSGTVTEVLASEGQQVTRGTPLLRIDASVQRRLVEQQQAQLEAGSAVYRELKAQPRPEALEVTRAQVALAEANHATAVSQLQKRQHAFELDSRAVSREVLDNARNAENVARANLELARRQLELTRAGTWSYELQTQRRQVDALAGALAASTALLDKYTLRAPADGVVLSIPAAVGSYVSPQGAFNSYTQGFGPVVSMGTAQQFLAVRCYIDEILIPRLPPADRMRATMVIRGTTQSVPLSFVRVQPYVQPKIQLSNQRSEKVDVRVLPILFRFQPAPQLHVYPGGLVDVYISST